MSKPERLLLLLNLLRGHRVLHAKELAERCGVHERTIYRDINSLSKLGVPVYFDKGYRILSKGFLPPTSLTEDEYLLLRLSLTVAGSFTDPNMERIREQLLAKLEGVMQESGMVDKYGGQNPVVIYPKSTDFEPLSTGKFKELERAIINRRTVRFDYESFESGRTTREVDPYVLVFRSRAWYLVGHCHRRQELRHFRATRIASLTVTDKVFNRPSDFDVRKHFEKSWDLYRGKPIRFKLRFKASAIKVIMSGRHHPSEKTTLRRNGQLIYEAQAEGEDEILRWILSFGPEVEVLSPPRLKQKHLDAINAMCEVYFGPGGRCKASEQETDRVFQGTGRASIKRPKK